MIPDVSAKTLVLHLNQDTDLPRRHGQRIKAAGGKYSDVRGTGFSNRFVTVPASETDLVDELVRTYRCGKETVIIVSEFRHGLASGRIVPFSTAPNTVMSWMGDEASGVPSTFVESTVALRVRAFDWAPWLSRWSAEDAATAERERRRDLERETAATLRAIGAEALRILDGAGELDGLKDLAGRYRELLAEAGVEEPAPAIASPHP